MKQQGFTLIEVITTIVIVAIVASMAGMLLATAFKKRLSGHNLMESVAEVRVTFNRMAESLRECKSILTMQNNRLRFRHLDGRTVTYRFNNNQLQYREDGGNYYTLATNVIHLSFPYWNKNRNTTNNPLNVRCISVELTTSVENVTQSWQTNICPRHLSQ